MGNFYLSFFSAYSAQSLYVGFLISTYNLLWTSLPTLASAIFDKDVSDRTVENNPQLYIESHLEKRHQFLWNISCWILTGLWHSAVAFFFPWCTIHTSEWAFPSSPLVVFPPRSHFFGKMILVLGIDYIKQVVLALNSLTLYRSMWKHHLLEIGIYNARFLFHCHVSSTNLCTDLLK